MIILARMVQISFSLPLWLLIVLVVLIFLIILEVTLQVNYSDFTILGSIVSPVLGFISEMFYKIPHSLLSTKRISLIDFNESRFFSTNYINWDKFLKKANEEQLLRVIREQFLPNGKFIEKFIFDEEFIKKNQLEYISYIEEYVKYKLYSSRSSRTS